MRLASATATTITGLRASIRASQGSSVSPRRSAQRTCAMAPQDQEPPEVALTHLRYPAQPGLAARAVLARHQPEPGREVAPAAEALHRRREGLDRRRADRADARDRHQPRSLFVAPRVDADLLLQAGDLRIEGRDPLQQERAQLMHRRRKRRPRLIGLVRAPRARRPTWALPCGATMPNSARCPRSALIVCVRWRTSRSRTRNSIPRACCSSPLHRHEAHGRPLRRLADRLRVRRVVLLALHEGLHVDRRDQPDLMAELHDLPAPVVRARTRLHRHHAARLRSEERQQRPPAQRLAEHDRAVRPGAVQDRRRQDRRGGDADAGGRCPTMRPTGAGARWPAPRASRRTTVHRIWGAFGLQPHRVESFKLSSDPLFVDKVRDIIGLYLDPPERALVLCVDEKSQIQALDRTQPMLPMRPGQAERRTHDYKRCGTTTLFAALDTATGAVVGTCMKRHRAREFRAFLAEVEQTVPADLDVHGRHGQRIQPQDQADPGTGSPRGRAGTATSHPHPPHGSTRSSASSRS